MTIAFESDEGRVLKLRERLCRMTDAELLRFGKAGQSLCRDRRNREQFEWQLIEARAEWRRRHPKE
jgi:hypothetical protein